MHIFELKLILIYKFTTDSGFYCVCSALITQPRGLISNMTLIVIEKLNKPEKPDN